MAERPRQDGGRRCGSPGCVLKSKWLVLSNKERIFDSDQPPYTLQYIVESRLARLSGASRGVGGRPASRVSHPTLDKPHSRLSETTKCTKTNWNQTGGTAVSTLESAHFSWALHCDETLTQCFACSGSIQQCH